MKQLLRVFAGTLVLLVAILAGHLPAAHAAEGFNVLTSPLPIKISTEPGKTVTTELRIKNQNSSPEGIKVGLMKFGATGETGTPTLADVTAKDRFGSWVTFSPNQFVAQPNVWVTVKMTIKVPNDAAFGYYMAVTFSPASQTGAPETTSLKGSAATLVLLNVKNPNEKRALQLADFTSQRKVYEYLPASFDIKVRNGGNVYLAPTGNIFIMRGNKVIDTLDVNTIGGSVLPGTNRVFTIPWQNGFPRFIDKIQDGKPVPGKDGKPQQTLKWDFTQANKIRFGKYSAKLLIAYDDGRQDVPLQSTVSFWVIPWKILLVVLLILLVIGFGIFTLVRSVFGRARSQAGKYKRRGR